jgi:N-acetylneuraminate synthase
MGSFLPPHTLVIAEAGVNHNGRLDLALRLVDAAAKAGADAVKFQTFDAERLVTRDAPKAAYQVTDQETSQYEMLRRLQLSPDDHRRVQARCRERGVVFISTPFDEHDADFLEGLGVPLFKVPSGEVTNLAYLAHVARLGKPMLVSTGMCYLGEVEAAVRAIRGAGCRDLALLHCVSNYPADPAEVNLRAMKTMEVAFGVPVGYSDHTLGGEVALAAVALGARVIEKHFTLDRALSGPDHAASLEPGELASLVRGIRAVESALGDGQKRPSPSELGTAAAARKSLVSARDLRSGEVLTEELIAVKRPGTGLPPAMRPHVIGRRLRVDAPEGTVLTMEMLS